jgi:hypothetical protein
MSSKNEHHVDTCRAFRCNAQCGVANSRDLATTESGEARGTRANNVSPHAVLNHLKHRFESKTVQDWCCYPRSSGVIRLGRLAGLYGS